MIEFLVSWAEQLIVALIIIVVVEMILPSQSSYKNYIKIILGIFILYVVITPLINNKISSLEFKSVAAENTNNAIQYENTINYEKQIESAYKIKLKEELNQYLNEKQYELIKINSELSYKNDNLEIEKIEMQIKRKKQNAEGRISINKIQINSNEEISQDEIKKLVEDIEKDYEIEKGKISISESEKSND